MAIRVTCTRDIPIEKKIGIAIGCSIGLTITAVYNFNRFIEIITNFSEDNIIVRELNNDGIIVTFD
jgi:RNase H-fold protein (predicted Holliday junction resolvase)